ncbi:MAG: TIGR04372 family glycosyltransferase [Ilumatobacteraceae bacterium]
MLRALSWILSFVGVVQFVRLSNKGRATLWVENLEPKIRKKWIRRKFFPPVLVAINSVEYPSTALAETYSKQVVLINSQYQGRFGEALHFLLDHWPLPKLGPYRLLRRPGSSFEMPSWADRRGSTHEMKRLLEAMGLDPMKDFVLLSVRDASYYELLQRRTNIVPGPETSSNTFVRNPDIESYYRVVRSLRDSGIHVLRFGIVDSSLPDLLRGIVVDYSIDFRSPHRDLLLGQHCLAMLSGASGAWCFASMFNRPVVYTNLLHRVLAGVSPRDRFIPQLLFSEKRRRLLTFEELFSTAGRYSYADNCANDGIRPVANTPEELQEVAFEALNLDSELIDSTGDDALLHDAFRKIANRFSIQPKHMALSRGRIGTRFLRRYRELL